MIDLTGHTSPGEGERYRWMDRKRVAAEEALTDRVAGSGWMDGWMDYQMGGWRQTVMNGGEDGNISAEANVTISGLSE